ncbi:ankyrin repeat domain-containing protein [bacterium]|nr:ankyrin repeat domain-containing protein [bacterium]
MHINIRNCIFLSLLPLSLRPSFSVCAQTIHKAVLEGDTAAVANCIVKDPASLEERDANGRTPLHLACFRADVPMVRFLIGHGADAGAVTNAGLTPLHWAVHSFEDTLRKEGVVDILVREAPETTAARDDKGITPLFWAAADSRTTLEILTSHGADVNARDHNGYTPLHHWTKWWVNDRTLWLLEHGADVNARDSSGRTPLHAAAVTGRRERAGLLLTHGAGINVKDEDGRTPLDLAVWYHHPGLESFLIGKGGVHGDGGCPEVTAVQFPGSSGQSRRAVVWYLENQGIAVTIESHLLIFNYVEWGIPPETPSLANGHIAPAELTGYHTFIFTTGTIPVDSALSAWAGSDSLVQIIRPAGPGESENGIVVEPCESQVRDGVTITAIPASGGGVSYLLEAEGVSIWYGGNHGLWTEQTGSSFREGLAAVHDRAPSPDLCFVNVCGGRAVSELAMTGIIEAASLLRPRLLFPVGGGGSWKFVYEHVRDRAERAGLPCRVICFRDRGDRWSGNKIGNEY